MGQPSAKENGQLLARLLDTAQHRLKRRGRTGRIDPSTGTLIANPNSGLPTNRTWVRVGATTRDDPGRELRAVWNFGTVSALRADVPVELDLNADGEWEITGLDTTIANREYAAAAPTYTVPAIPDELNQTLITAEAYTPTTSGDWPEGEPTTKAEALDTLAARDNALTVATDDVSNPPTDAELDTTFGTPATVGAGFTALLDDDGADTDVYLVASNGTSWFFVALTKAT